MKNEKSRIAIREERLAELLEGIKDDKRTLLEGMVVDLLHIEEKLEELRELPFIRVHPSDPMKQKVTPASKLYKDLVSSQNSTIRQISGILNIAGDDGDSESPLALYLKKMNGGDSK